MIRHLVVGLVLAAAAGAQTPVPLPPHLVVTGEGQVKATPDRATVFVGVQTRASTAAAASADNSRRQRAIIDTVKALGLPPEQITTENYSVSPEMNYPQGGGTPKVTGYVVDNTVRVELRKIDQVASVIDASLAKGANQINGLQFSVSNAAEVRRSAIAEAVRNARADAEALATAAGGTVGPLIEMSTSGPAIRPVFAAMVASNGATMARATPVEPGEQTISASVSATWTFVGRPPSR